MLKIKRMAK